MQGSTTIQDQEALADQHKVCCHWLIRSLRMAIYGNVYVMIHLKSLMTVKYTQKVGGTLLHALARQSQIFLRDETHQNCAV